MRAPRAALAVLTLVLWAMTPTLANACRIAPPENLLLHRQMPAELKPGEVVLEVEGTPRGELRVLRVVHGEFAYPFARYAQGGDDSQGRRWLVNGCTSAVSPGARGLVVGIPYAPYGPNTLLLRPPPANGAGSGRTLLLIGPGSTR